MNHRSQSTFLLCIPLGFAALAGIARAQSDVTAPGNPTVGVGSTPGTPTSTASTVGTVPGANNFPGTETPNQAIDNFASTKYLNFAEINVGLITTPPAPSVVTGFRITTANDAPERDPNIVSLEGTNDPNATTSLNSTWTNLFHSDGGLLTDPGRNTPGPIVPTIFTGSFTSYRFLVMTVRNSGTANSMQFAEIELFGSAAGVAFCPGDGTGTACPCANNSAPGSLSGCLNSLGTAGKLVAGGTASLSGDSVVLAGTQMASSSALYFQGTAQAAAGAGALFGDGKRCASGTVIRLGIKTNVGGASSYPVFPESAVSVRGQVLSPGTRTYQVWYRNAAAFCSPSTFNLTNGWLVTWSA